MSNCFKGIKSDLQPSLQGVAKLWLDLVHAEAFLLIKSCVAGILNTKIELGHSDKKFQMKFIHDWITKYVVMLT